MNKDELVRKVSKDTNYGIGVVSSIVDSVLDNITSELKNNEKVVLSGFGTFKSTLRKPRTGRDICAGKPIRIPERYVPSFEASKVLKDAVSKEV